MPRRAKNKVAGPEWYELIRYSQNSEFNDWYVAWYLPACSNVGKTSLSGETLNKLCRQWILHERASRGYTYELTGKPNNIGR